MKNKELGSFQNLILRRITFHIKNFTPLKGQEIKKIFSNKQFFVSSLYYFLYSPTKKKQSITLIESMAIMEILIIAGLLHQTIEESSSHIATSGEQGNILKNTRKILLGDMLIATAVNIINSFEPQLQKEYFIISQKFFLGKVEEHLSKKTRKPKPLYEWIQFFPKLNKKLIKKRKKDKPHFSLNKIIQLLNDISSLEPQRIASSIDSLEKSMIRKGIDKKADVTFISWLQKQILDMQIFNMANANFDNIPKLKNITPNKKNSILQLLS